LQTILIVDLEATCWDDRPQTVGDMEIIEFGCTLASIEGVVTSSFHQMVRPTLSPVLSDFCQSLTGITQAMVDNAPVYQEAVQRLDSLVGALQFDAWASWGQHDLNQINIEHERHGVSPSFATAPHINLKALWQQQKGSKRRAGIGAALASVGLAFEGRQHRGEDDTRNIARLLSYLDFSAV